LQSAKGPAQEAGARRFALTLGRSFALLLLARHAQWSLDHERNEGAFHAARRFARHGVDLVGNEDLEGSAALAGED
jgi:hypothetical protein